MLDITYYYSGFYPYFILSDNITFKEIEEIFGILTMLIKRKKRFIFLLDGRNIKSFPTFKAGYFILNWKKTHNSEIPGTLLASSIVLNNKIIVDILNWVFKQQKPVSPNIITKHLDEGRNFLNPFIPKELKNNIKKNIYTNYRECQETITTDKKKNVNVEEMNS